MSTRTVAGGITAPAGYTAAGVSCGIKPSGRPDLGIVASDRLASAAAVFTTNLAQAAPVLISRDHLERSGGRARAIVVNSGCANACTGADGMAHAASMARQTSASLPCRPEEVLVASTGVIGVKLDMAKVCRGITDAAKALSYSGGPAAAVAIMTTDPFPKEAAVESSLGASPFRVGGMAKGSGMIEPMMATMLGFVTTDAQVDPALLQRALEAAVNDTFNAITVDGECSTNDCVFLLANGASGATVTENEGYQELVAALTAVCEALAIGIVRGGEGATKLIAVTVRDARSSDGARQVARTIANSPLVKTAVHGADPNWGRIVAAAGRSGVVFDVNRTTIRVGGVLLFENGLPHDEAAPQAAEHLQGRTVQVDVGLGTGGGASATIWTCDLSAEYVRINGEYRT